MNISFEEFNEFWAGCFGNKLTDRNGIDEWRTFVEGEKISVRGLRETVQEFAGEYNRLQDEGRNPTVPALSRVRQRYFDTLRDRQRKWNADRAGMTGNGIRCAACSGSGRVWALAPAIDDRDRKAAPPDFRTIDPSHAYLGVEAYPCPVCRESEYRDPYLRERVRNHSLPELVGAEHPDNPFGWPSNGGRLIIDVMHKRMTKGTRPLTVAANNVEIPF